MTTYVTIPFNKWSYKDRIRLLFAIIFGRAILLPNITFMEFK